MTGGCEAVAAAAPEGLAQGGEEQQGLDTGRRAALQAKLTQQEQEMKREHQRLRAQQQRRHELQLEAQRMTQRHDREQLTLRIAKEVYQQKWYATYSLLAEDTSAGHEGPDIGIALHTVKTEVTQTAEAAAFDAGYTDARKVRIAVLKNEIKNQEALKEGQQQQRQHQQHQQQDKEEGGAAKSARAPGGLGRRSARVVTDELAAPEPPAETLSLLPLLLLLRLALLLRPRRAPLPLLFFTPLPLLLLLQRALLWLALLMFLLLPHLLLPLLLWLLAMRGGESRGLERC
ncbi:hypothetical protein JKP88DRAFT_353664 [Tribonema minus]|uniref:Uncharacterized protein n=1 Tax=Tribonema minus TaxID=303371 RepID=A0A836CJJ0_9STRA|nr:hypothetical protein JKP88DRAFT_353664 [Tribonema minus]